MQYASRKLGHRILFCPDKEFKEVLQYKLKTLKEETTLKSSISCFGKEGGLRGMLSRHHGHRFFMTVDLVHAFHRVRRGMIAELLQKIDEPRFDICFVEMMDARLGFEEVIPIGFTTSSYLFELFLSLRIDRMLTRWQNEYEATITRYADNLLLTWQKNPHREILWELQRIFKGIEIRLTPREPRKWQRHPIRFCGVTFPKDGRPHLSNSSVQEILARARQKGLPICMEGAQRFIELWNGIS